MSGDSGDRIERPDLIVDPQRMEVFIEAMTPPGPPRLRKLEEEALAQGVPIIRPQTQNLLRFFLAMKKPARILEIGTATGFSALYMQQYAPAGCRIVTIEKDAARAEAARKNFSRYGREENRLDRPDAAESGTFSSSADALQGDALQKNSLPESALHGDFLRAKLSAGSAPIELLEGDAAQILPLIRDISFDLVFMDAAKGQYLRLLPDALRLLAPEGLLITDNILQEGEILSSRFAVTRRNRTIHHRMREFVRALMTEPSLQTLLLSAGDGTAVSVKRPQAVSGSDEAGPGTEKVQTKSFQDEI